MSFARALAVPLLLFISATAVADLLRGEVVGITDGDTITLLVNREQYKVRLAEVDTPERGQPWGARARQSLSKKVFRENVTIEIVDTDRYGRLVGKIWIGDRDINRELVAEGFAWVYRDYMRDASLLKDEESAREASLGLWSAPDPVPPWLWRRGERSSVADDNSIEADSSCGSKRYCREMSSCAEAKFYLNECGLTRLDGDEDGVPCESICR